MLSSGLRIFVSHSHADNEFGVQLVQSLRRAYGEHVVWYDSQGGLYGGDNWWHKILKELTEREVFIVVLSPDAVKSKWVNDEITIAWDQKNSSTGKTIIPILYRDCKVRPDLKTLQYISFLPPNTYDQAFYDLMRALEVRFPIPRRTTRSLSPLSSTTLRRQTQSLSPSSSKRYNRRPAQSSPTTPSAPQRRRTQPLPATFPPTASSRRKAYGSEFPGFDSQQQQSTMPQAARLEAIREANRREGRQKKSSQRRLYYYENTMQVRRTPYFYDDTSSYEDRPLVDLPVDLKLEPESDKLPAVRHTPFSFVDDPLPQELTQQIAGPVVRRASRLAAVQYSDDDDYSFLAPEQIDREMFLHTDEHPEIPRIRRASARSLVHRRRKNAVTQNSLYSLPVLVMSNKKAAYFTIGIVLFVMILTILLLAPFLAGISLLILVLALIALLAVVMGYLYSHYQKK